MYIVAVVALSSQESKPESAMTSYSTGVFVYAALSPHRLRDLRAGTVVGEDHYGNKYYENKEYFFGMLCYMHALCCTRPAEWAGMCV